MDGAAALLMSLALAGGAPHALADEAVPDLKQQSDNAASGGMGAVRPFLFTLDPSLPDPGHVALSAGMGNVTKSGEQRPIGAGQVVPTIGAEVGILSHLSVFLDEGTAFSSADSSLPSPVTVEIGAHILLTDPTSRHFHLALKASYSRDFQAASAANLDAALAYNTGILRVVASLTGSHTFAPGADALDFGGTLGATVGLPLGFRVGLEAVAVDLEEATDEQAEGGPAAFAGPTVGWAWGDRVQLVGGPAFGISPGNINASVLFRVAADVQF
jgi:hypothetical protein